MKRTDERAWHIVDIVSAFLSSLQLIFHLFKHSEVY